MKNSLINSTLAFITAFLITTFIHELGHFFSYICFGASPILYSNYVDTPGQQLELTPQIISTLAGPVLSLLQGIIFALLVSKNKKNTAFYLVFLWLSLLGFVNFFGYLMMTPLSTAGDTGKVAELMQIGGIYRIVVAVAGLIMLIAVILKTGKHFASFIPANTDAKLKNKYVYALMFFPIIIGSLFNTALSLPAPVWLSVIYPATSSFVIMSSFGSILKVESLHTSKSELEDKIQISLIFLFVGMVIINRLLTMGFSL